MEMSDQKLRPISETELSDLNRDGCDKLLDSYGAMRRLAADLAEARGENARLKDELQARAAEAHLLREEVDSTVQASLRREPSPRLNQVLADNALLLTVVALADAARCEWEMENGPSYDLADPFERAMAEMMQALCELPSSLITKALSSNGEVKR